MSIEKLENKYLIIEAARDILEFTEKPWFLLWAFANLEAKYSTKQSKHLFHSPSLKPFKMPWIKGFDFDLSCLTTKRHCYRKSHGKAVSNRFCCRNINTIRYWT